MRCFEVAGSTFIPHTGSVTRAVAPASCAGPWWCPACRVVVVVLTPMVHVSVARCAGCSWLLSGKGPWRHRPVRVCRHPERGVSHDGKVKRTLSVLVPAEPALDLPIGGKPHLRGRRRTSAARDGDHDEHRAGGGSLRRLGEDAPVLRVHRPHPEGGPHGGGLPDLRRGRREHAALHPARARPRAADRADQAAGRPLAGPGPVERRREADRHGARRGTAGQDRRTGRDVRGVAGTRRRLPRGPPAGVPDPARSGRRCQDCARPSAARKAGGGNGSVAGAVQARRRALEDSAATSGRAAR